MGKISLEKKIIKQLWEKDFSKEELKSLFGDITNACDNLVFFRIIQINEGICTIACPVGVGKNKKILNNTTTTLEEILSYFDKRKSAHRSNTNYATYDDSKGRGSKESWERAAKLLLGQLSGESTHLSVLGFTKKPETFAELRKKYLVLIKKEHPDVGGDPIKAEKIINAFQTLKKLY